MSQSFSARFFDGQSSRPHDVVATVDADRLQLHGPAIDRTFALASTRVSQRLDHAPRLLTFTDGSYCEVVDQGVLDEVLAATGFSGSLVGRLQGSWRYALGASLAAVAVIAIGYLCVLPWAARIAAGQVPADIEEKIGRDSVEWIDKHLFEPSHLPETDQARITQAFARIVPQDRRKYRIEFRRSHIGPNALAFPGGIIVLTDELVALAPNDDAVLGVLAHELGHIEHRHFLRRLITSTVTGAVATLLAGDASGIAAAIPATLADLSYSRDMEREADEYAIERLHAAGLPLAPLADLLEKLEAVQAERAKGGGGRGVSMDGYLSTHPATEERIRKLREGT